MKIVIDIPEERYEFIKGLDNTCYDIHTAIAQGIPLPKGHGDLISREALKKAMEQADKEAIDYEMLAGMYEHLVRNAPTVIPADK